MTEPATNKVKSQVLHVWSVVLQKLKHLKQELSDDPVGGFVWWLKTHKQKPAFDAALANLLQNARKPNFKLNEVTRVFSQFILKEDDAGQVQWYQDAHDKLTLCQQQLEEATVLKLDMVKPAITELRFISEADQFHEHFQLQPLQRRVRDMYEAILERLDILLEDTKNNQLLHKQEIEIRNKEAEVQQAAEKARHSKNKLKKEKAALKKVKKERQLLDSQRDAEEEAWKREEADRKLQIQESQQQHQKEIQDSFQALEIANNQPVTTAPEESNSDANKDGSRQQMENLLQQIQNGKLDRNDPEIKEQLQALLQAIAGL